MRIIRQQPGVPTMDKGVPTMDKGVPTMDKGLPNNMLKDYLLDLGVNGISKHLKTIFRGNPSIHSGRSKFVFKRQIIKGTRRF